MRNYLQLKNYPMYLDETGAGFDDIHRLSLIAYIKDFLSSNNCSQMFYVNHYDTMFGAFSNTGTVVLDETNITISKPFNENVIFNEEYRG
jgi:ABC-type molybdenum transport system ATPase subunit/photorepair protein PhrA